MRVAVVGASGYAGGELLRLIAGHPDLDLVTATADSSAGKAVGDVHPNLAGHPGLANLIFEPHSAVKGAGADLVFLALPAGQSAPMAADIGGNAAIVDLGPDFRLADAAAWARHYDGDHPGRWVTGLPELPGIRPVIRQRNTGRGSRLLRDCRDRRSRSAGGGRPDQLRRRRRGCRVGDLGRWPVAARGPARQRGHGLGVGLSGGRIAPAHPRDRAGSRTKSAPDRLGQPPGFPSPLCWRRCRAASSPPARRRSRPPGSTRRRSGRRSPPPAPTSHLSGCCQTGRWPGTGAVAGSNGVQVQAAADPRSGRVTVVTAIDNLGKGAAGQAIQNANLMLGLPETAGLTSIGVAP